MMSQTRWLRALATKRLVKKHRERARLSQAAVAQYLDLSTPVFAEKESEQHTNCFSADDEVMLRRLLPSYARAREEAIRAEPAESLAEGAAEVVAKAALLNLETAKALADGVVLPSERAVCDRAQDELAASHAQYVARLRVVAAL